MNATARTVLCIAGARPNFMKIAPVIAALRAQSGLRVRLVHTGQHYDEAMNDRFFAQLGIPVPDINLEVGSLSHAVQSAEIMRRFEPVLDDERPAAVVVVGDVNSTIACALVAAKKGVPVAHVEAGLRSYDRAMPEEINRVLTDQLSDWLFITEREARDNLLREGIAGERIHFVGNVMIDTLLGHRTRAVPAGASRGGGGDALLSRCAGGFRRAHAAPAVECRRRGRAHASLALHATHQHAIAAGVPGAPAHARAHRGRGSQGADRRPARAVPAATGLSRDAGPHVGCARGVDRFGRYPGRDHRARRAVYHPA